MSPESPGPREPGIQMTGALKKTYVTLPNFGQMTFSLFWQPLSVTIATINVDQHEIKHPKKIL